MAHFVIAGNEAISSHLFQPCIGANILATRLLLRLPWV